MKNQQQYREEIMEFCRNFINGNNKHLLDVIDNDRHLLTQINIHQLNLTQETFDITFKNICRKLFDIRLADKSFIIPLLGFALTLNEYHLSHHYSWYHTEILMDSLTDILAGVDFQVKELNKTFYLTKYVGGSRLDDG